jgi:hypothetical protein
LKKRHLILPCLLLSLSLAACGGGGGSGDETKIVDVLEKSLGQPSSTTCRKDETKAYLEQTTHASAATAIKVCETRPPGAKNIPVDISNVKVDGSKATADAAFSSGGFDGQTLTIALVKEGDQWKLDEIAAFAKLDKQALIKGIKEKLAGVNPKLAGCITKGLSQASTSVYEAVLLQGEQGPIEKIAQSCLKTH